MSRQRPRRQPGTIEARLVEPGKRNAPASYEGFAGEPFRSVGDRLEPGVEIGVKLAGNSVQREEGFAQEEQVELHWMPLQSQFVYDRERGVQRIVDAFRERNSDGLIISLQQLLRDLRQRLVARNTAETQRNQRAAERRREPARLAPI